MATRVYSSASQGSCAFSTAARRDTARAYIEGRASSNVVIREIASQPLLFGANGLTWNVEVTSARTDSDALHAQILNQLTGQFTPLPGSRVETYIGERDTVTGRLEYVSASPPLRTIW